MAAKPKPDNEPAIDDVIADHHRRPDPIFLDFGNGEPHQVTQRQRDNLWPDVPLWAPA